MQARSKFIQKAKVKARRSASYCQSCSDFYKSVSFPVCRFFYFHLSAFCLLRPDDDDVRDAALVGGFYLVADLFIGKVDSDAGAAVQLFAAQVACDLFRKRRLALPMTQI